MGNRKKKKSSRKRSLLFEESPSEYRRHLLSPVMCVENPVTALSVLVENGVNTSWVSPQFNGITVSCGKCRQRRHRSTCIGRRNLERENIHTEIHKSRNHYHHGTRKKFCALEFASDQSKKPATVNKRFHQLNSKSIIVPGKAAVISSQRNRKSLNVCNSDVADSSLVNMVRRRNCSFRKTRNFKLHSSPQLCASLGDYRANPSSSSDLQKVSLDKRQFTSPLAVTSNVTKALETEHGGSFTSDEINKSKRELNTSNILLSPLETLNLSPLHEDPILHLRVALLQSLSEDACTDTPESSYTKRMTSYQGDSFTPNFDRSSFGREDKFQNVNKRSKCKNSESQKQCLLPRRSKRLQEKYIKALQCLHPETPTAAKKPLTKHNTKVLVVDTPEPAYHLTFRQRQRMLIIQPF